jgi:hypothetical protein
MAAASGVRRYGARSPIRSGPVFGIAPLARSVTPVNFRSEVASISIPHGIAPGTYTWLSALTAAGTMNLVSEIAAQRFVITP